MKERFDKKKSGEKSEKTAMSRRRFLRGVFGTGAVVSAIGLKALERAPETVGEKEVVRELTFLEARPHPRTYQMGSLSGMKFGPQFNRYFGFKEQTKLVGEMEKIDFSYQLAEMYQKKFGLFKGDEPAEEYDAHHEGLLAPVEALYRGYAPPEPGKGPSLDEYHGRIASIVEEMERAVHLPRIDKKFKLSKSQSRALELFVNSLDADLLLSYAMTELMPSEDGRANAAVYEFLLKNAGAGYVERIPALGDRLMSFGPYQFTRKALYSGLNERGVHEVNGASIIDMTLERSVLPPNVESLRDDDHYKAAYLLALYNVVLLVKDLGDVRCAQVLVAPSLAGAAMRDYVIAAHHRPVEARQGFCATLEQLRTNKKASIDTHCSPDVRTYIKKTHANSSAIRSRLALK